MRILIVTQYFWPENFRINEIAAHLKGKGNDVEVFTGIPNYPSGKIFEGWSYFKRLQETYKGIPIKRVPHFPRGNGKALSMILNFISFALMGSLLAPFLVKGRFDVIFVYGLTPVTLACPAIALKKAKRIPIVFWLQDLWPESLEFAANIKSKTILGLVSKISSWIYKQADRMLITSKSFRKALISRGVEEERIFYYPQAAENFYRPLDLQSVRSKGFSLPEGFRILFAGNIGMAQGIETIVEAAKRCRGSNIKWIIIGQGREFERIKNLVFAENLEESVFLLGQKPAEEMPDWFAMADALLVTLKKDPVYAMTVPAKIQSYMACGKPILAALDGEASSLVLEAGAGLAVPAEDAEGLALAAREMAGANQETLKEWAKNSRQYFLENFQFEESMHKLMGHFWDVQGKEKQGSENHV